MKAVVFLFLFFTLLPSYSMAKIKMPYYKMFLTDVEQLERFIHLKRTQYDKNKDSEVLFDATLVILSRPDDGNLHVLFPKISDHLEVLDLFETIIGQVVDEALQGLSNKKESNENIATYTIALVNLISELKSDKDNNFKKSILAKIRDAKINDKIHERANSEIVNRIANKPFVNPSTIAKTVIGT